MGKCSSINRIEIGDGISTKTLASQSANAHRKSGVGWQVIGRECEHAVSDDMRNDQRRGPTDPSRCSAGGSRSGSIRKGAGSGVTAQGVDPNVNGSAAT